ncbi:hypothetical protein LH20_05985 [Sphingopyxis sp. 113P3]|nr:hypothetical protein LH20_05985 [Sphingopyxis sp. 113P3]
MFRRTAQSHSNGLNPERRGIDEIAANPGILVESKVKADALSIDALRQVHREGDRQRPHVIDWTDHVIGMPVARPVSFSSSAKRKPPIAARKCSIGQLIV